MDAFVWDGRGFLMQWPPPVIAAVAYLTGCVVHNRSVAALSSAPKATSQKERGLTLLDRAAVAHNAVLVVFSAVVCTCSTLLVAQYIGSVGWREFLCDSRTSEPQSPLRGPLHGWCFVFYVSKYYEMVDTLLIVLRGRRVIALHALHHALMPLVMYLLFEGTVSVSLVALSVVNSFVHIVMYSYYLATALNLRPPDVWKKQITRLQIFQFSLGVFGGTYYWICYFRDLRVSSAWPPRFSYTPGCAGGEPRMVLIGYVMNLSLLLLFSNFYIRAYGRRNTGIQRSTAPGKVRGD